MKGKICAIILILLVTILAFASEKTYVLLSAAFNFDTAGFYILDATNPEEPVVTYEMTPVENGGLALFENKLYLGTYKWLTTEMQELEYADYIIIDIEDIDNPKQINSLRTPTGNPCWTVRKGDYLFGTGFEAGMHVLKAEDLSNPSLIKTLALPGFDNNMSGSRDIVLNGNYVYLATMGFCPEHTEDEGPTETSGFFVIDIADPENPDIIQFIHTGETGIVDFKVHDDKLYCSSFGKGIEVFDLSNPANPKHLITRYYTNPNPCCIYIHGKYAYVADEGHGMLVFDVSDPADLQLINIIDTPGKYGEEVLVFDDLLYLADGFSGLGIYDITNPESPSLISQTNIGDSLAIAMLVIKR